MTALAATPALGLQRWLWLLSPAIPFSSLVSLVAYAVTGNGWCVWQTPATIYLIVPVLDFAFGRDARNPPEQAIPALEADRFYRWIVLVTLPLHYAAVLLGAWLAVTRAADGWDYAGLVLTVGGIGGVAINAAHELGHKREQSEKWLARVALAPMAYGHFYVEHNRGHHRRVATQADPASARLGESFWRFLPRSVIGGAASAWALEADRMARSGKPVWSPANDVLNAWAMTAVLFAALTAWLGWAALPFLALQAAYGVSLLEVVNYVEHYGLLRARRPGGGYEPCRPEHSWNSDVRIGNLTLYHLQRHSDHHANPGRRYQALRHFDESPQLPAGYATLITIAYLPPLWFRLMDRRVIAHYRGDATRANLAPHRRRRLTA